MLASHPQNKSVILQRQIIGLSELSFPSVPELTQTRSPEHKSPTHPVLMMIYDDIRLVQGNEEQNFIGGPGPDIKTN